jgi:predicted neuraminidase
MDSSISLKDQIWFLRVCHHVSNVLYNKSSPIDVLLPSLPSPSDVFIYLIHQSKNLWQQQLLSDLYSEHLIASPLTEYIQAFVHLFNSVTSTAREKKFVVRVRREWRKLHWRTLKKFVYFIKFHYVGGSKRHAWHYVIYSLEKLRESSHLQETGLDGKLILSES